MVVRDLDQDAGTITDCRVGAGGAAVIEVAQRGDPVGDDAVAPPARDIHDRGNTAGVVLERRVVQARRRRRCGVEHCSHPRAAVGARAAGRARAAFTGRVGRRAVRCVAADARQHRAGSARRRGHGECHRRVRRSVPRDRRPHVVTRTESPGRQWPSGSRYNTAPDSGDFHGPHRARGCAPPGDQPAGARSARSSLLSTSSVRRPARSAGGRTGHAGLPASTASVGGRPRCAVASVGPRRRAASASAGSEVPSHPPRRTPPSRPGHPPRTRSPGRRAGRGPGPARSPDPRARDGGSAPGRPRRPGTPRSRRRR